MNTTTSGWQLRRIQGPELEPVSLELARIQCKVDPDITSEDPLIEDILIPAARQAVEENCKITLCESTWRYTLREFPEADGAIELPRGPLIEVVRVSYLNNEGVSTAYETYQVEPDIMPPRILPAHLACWPFARCGSGSVVIEYRAGYPGLGSPAGAEGVPAAIKQTMLALIGFWFENREAGGPVNLEEFPYGWDFALAPYRVYP